jgi:hypothetical protein
MGVAPKPLGSNSGANIPEEHTAIAASRDKTLVIGSDRKTQDLVAVGGIGLDETTLGDAVAILAWNRGAGEWVVEAD